MLYGIQTGFGSPQVPVAELLSRPVPTLMSPHSSRGKSSNFLQVPEYESPRPKSVPSSPMVKRAFSRLGTITAGWGRSIKKQHPPASLNVDDKKKWASSQDCSGNRFFHTYLQRSFEEKKILNVFHEFQQRKMERSETRKIKQMLVN